MVSLAFCPNSNNVALSHSLISLEVAISTSISTDVLLCTSMLFVNFRNRPRPIITHEWHSLCLCADQFIRNSPGKTRAFDRHLCQGSVGNLTIAWVG